jgi:hypothetical protein
MRAIILEKFGELDNLVDKDIPAPDAVSEIMVNPDGSVCLDGGKGQRFAARRTITSQPIFKNGST